MSDRDLTTTRTQVFGDVSKGTTCRVCGRDVEDGRAKTCSDYCSNLLSAVMGMLNWNSVRRRIIERDDETCQECGYDRGLDSRAARQIRERIDAYAGEESRAPSMLKLGRGEVDDDELERARRAHEAWRRARDEAKQRYGTPHELGRTLEVDHITPVADGGHPFDPANLQTLCEDCHGEKTARENSNRRRTPSRQELNESLFDYVADGGE